MAEDKRLCSQKYRAAKSREKQGKERAEKQTARCFPLYNNHLTCPGRHSTHRVIWATRILSLEKCVTSFQSVFFLLRFFSSASPFLFFFFFFASPGSPYGVEPPRYVSRLYVYLGKLVLFSDCASC